MTRPETTLILWSAGFDELTAAVFVTILRKAGIQARLVGLPCIPTPGVNGLVLTPDMTLEQAIALAEHVSAIIAPASASALRRLSDDPRVCALIARAARCGAVLVTGADAASTLSALASSEGEEKAVHMIVYNDYLALVEFASRLAERLAAPTTIVPD